MKEYKVYNSHNISHANGYIKFAYHTRAYMYFVQQTGKQIGIWQVYWGSGKQIRDLAGRLWFWQADRGFGRQIGDLAGRLRI